MRERWTTFDDFVTDIGGRYGDAEADPVRETFEALVDRDIKAQS